ncbi:hypothetical protein Trco_004858 [Trichoderma cornu-damae]|uniref:Uncharacterized protein n=1 Tax=Trichoderma cornu-damae TaxID=654480 RepID=A0A9P8QGI3_9HYPO|nr:hypothetical protein Trco_004858 [Trichoderma cornu-damae]
MACPCHALHAPIPGPRGNIDVRDVRRNTYVNSFDAEHANLSGIRTNLCGAGRVSNLDGSKLATGNA